MSHYMSQNRLFGIEVVSTNYSGAPANETEIEFKVGFADPDNFIQTVTVPGDRRSDALDALHDLYKTYELSGPIGKKGGSLPPL